MASNGWVETDKYIAGVVRMIKSAGRRVGEEQAESIEHLQKIQDALDNAWAHAVADLREAGTPDREIGERLNISRQAVQQRWPHSGDGRRRRV